jgi:hypothetical protein
VCIVSSWRRWFWRVSFIVWILCVVVVRVLLLQVVYNRDMVLFSFSFSRVHSSVIDIFVV